MKKILFIALLSLATMRVTGQTLNVDSLINMLETRKLTVQEQMDICRKICIFYRYVDLEKTKKYGNTGLNLALKEKNDTLSLYFHTYIAGAYKAKEESAYYDSALYHYNKAIEHAKLVDRYFTGNAYNNIAGTYSRKNDYTAAIEHYQQALLIGEEIGNKDICAMASINLGSLYRALDVTDLALSYLIKADTLAKDIDQFETQANVCNEIGIIYNKKGDNDKAIGYQQKALEISRKYQFKRNEIRSLHLIAEIYCDTGNYDKALEYAKESLQLCDDSMIRRELVNIWNKLADIYLSQRQYKEAEFAAINAWNCDSSDLTMLPAITNKLTIIYIQLAEVDKAIYYLDQFTKAMENFSDRESKNAIIELEVKYETEKKETRIATLEKERQLYLWLIVSGGLLLAALIIMLLLTVRNARKQRRLIAAEALQEGELSERSRIAQDLHDRLGGSLSAVKIGMANEETLQIISVKIDSCIKELREITNNIMPRSLQTFGMKGALEDFSADIANLHFHFFGEAGRIRQNLEYTVYCCARELVNNALKHSGAATVNLQLVQSKKYVTLTVQDDGCGFDEKIVRKGNGLTNIRNRVASCKGRIDVSSTPGKGTEAVIELLVSCQP